MRILPALIVCALALAPLPAETGATIAAAGYSGPAPIEAAPGQILTLFFRGLPTDANGKMRVAGAQTVPLPDTVAGISVLLTQPPQATPYRLPIIAVRQQNDCEEANGRHVCVLTAIRVQMPTELTPTFSKIVVVDNGEPSRTFLVRPIRDNTHVLTTCDLNWDTNPAANCARLAYHADGTRIDAGSPAQRGETIVVYAHGMGPTSPRAETGNAAPNAPLTDSVFRQLKVTMAPFRNASPNTPRYPENENPAEENTAIYAGLVPGQVGLYQINIRIPGSLTVPLPCGEGTTSNVLAKVATSQGVENLPLCVAP